MTDAKTETIGAAPTAERRPASACPFLLAESGEWRLAVASREHRCTAFNPPAALAPEKQERLCLTASHPSCATYLASLAAREARLSRVEEHPTRWRFARTTPVIEDPGGVGAVLLGLVVDRRRWPAIPAVILVTTLLTLAISGFRSEVPANAVATSTPSTTAPPARGASPRPTPLPTPSPAPASTPTAPPTSAPTATAAATPEPSYRTYRVRSGDTLSVIAARFGTTVRAIRSLNGITDPSRLRVGQVLLIPS